MNGLDATLTDWLTTIGDPDLLGTLTAMAVSTVAAVVTTCLYDYFYESRATGSQIQRSFLLMAPSITALFVAVQLSLPLSLGLLGALSIIRFRVPVKEPEEVAFLMVVIASSIACSTFNYEMLLGLFAIVIVGLTARRLLAGRNPMPRRANGLLVVTLPRTAYRDQGEQVEALLRNRLGQLRLEHLEGDDGITRVHFGFHGGPQVRWPQVEADLARLCPEATLAVMMSRAGGL